MPNRKRETPDRRRRRLLQAAFATLAVGWLRQLAGREQVRELAFYHLHTGESLRAVYHVDGAYLPDALHAIDHLLRDHRSGETRPIAPELLDLLFALRQRVGSDRPFHVISGYRSPTTNSYLRTRSEGVAKFSLHMVGRAIDVRLPGTATRTLRQAAVALKRGGVGYYPDLDFIHVDTGRVRYW